MAEYIERDMFLKIISHKPSSPTTDREDRLINGFISAVKNCPAADVRPVVRGKWTKKHDDVCYWFECSVCGQRPPWNEWGTEWQSPFCPNCGADMRPQPLKEET